MLRSIALAALLVAGTAAAQTGTPADAERAAVRLVEAVRARDMPALAAFVDPQTVADVLEGFPDTDQEYDAALRAALGGQPVDVDSLLEAIRLPRQVVPPGSAPATAAIVRLFRSMRALQAGVPPGSQAMMTRVLTVVVRCASDSMLALFDSLGYDPVRADRRADGTVEAIGRVSGTADGEHVEGLIVTPLRWTEGRWTVSDRAPEARDAEMNPLAGLLGPGSLDWAYALATALQADMEGTTSGCAALGE